MRTAVFLATSLLLPQSATAGLALRYNLYGRVTGANGDSLFGEAGDPRWGATQELRLRANEGGLRAQGRALVSWDEEENDSTVALILDELYLDRAVGPLDVTVGKKILSWGFGYGFRPLDVLHRAPRRRFAPTDLQGVPLVAAEYFIGESGAISGVYVNRMRIDARGAELGEHQLAFKLYWRAAPWDLQAITHVTGAGDVTGGVGVAGVLGDDLELHAEGTLARGCRRPVNRLTTGAEILADSDPFVEEQFTCGRVVAGAVWTPRGNLTLMLEAWHDGSAYGDHEWDALRSLAERQRELLHSTEIPEPAVRQNLEANQRAFAVPSLRKNNLVARAALIEERWETALDLLVTPVDLGLVVTLSLRYELWQSVELIAAGRLFTGAGGSAYAELPQRFAAYTGLRAAYAP